MFFHSKERNWSKHDIHIKNSNCWISNWKTFSKKENDELKVLTFATWMLTETGSQVGTFATSKSLTIIGWDGLTHLRQPINLQINICIGWSKNYKWGNWGLCAVVVGRIYGIRTILLWLLRLRVEIWKKVVFLSLCISQFILALMLQSSSSKARIFSSSPKRKLWRCINLLEGFLAKAFSAPRILTTWFFFFQKLLPNTSLFQTLALLVNSQISLHTLWWLPSHTSLTTLGNSSWLSQMGWKRKGLTPFLKGGESNERSRGQWSELILAKCFTITSWNVAFKPELVQTLSNLYWIKSVISLLLVQVYLIPENPRSIRLQ